MDFHEKRNAIPHDFGNMHKEFEGNAREKSGGKSAAKLDDIRKNRYNKTK